ncbi:MAG TPA: PTS sugar transporter subunit IIC [Longimicrobiaceae bacterium]|nr:PTS sugar transporter subunit IIC [Longimicrobiaceae bacterium]
MIPEPGALLFLVLLGGVAAVDGTSLGQFMLSRPVVAATLAGWIAGSPDQGALLGLFLEAFHLTVLPVGAARYPEGGPAAVAAAGAYAGTSHSFSALLVTLILALLWERLGGLSVQEIRKLNVRFSPRPGTESISPSLLSRGHLLALTVDFARGASLTAAGVLLFGWILEEAIFLLPHGSVARLALGVALAAALGASLRLFGNGRVPLLLAGAAVGILLLVLFP